MRPMRSDEKAKWFRRLPIALFEKLQRRIDPAMIVKRFEFNVVEPIFFPMSVMRNLAERNDLVAELLQVSRKLGDFSTWARMIRFGTVAGWHQSSQESSATRSAAR